MESHRHTRRAFVVRGVAATVAAGVALDAVSKAGAAGGERDLVVGHFMSADGRRSALVKVLGGRPVSVTLDPEAFVAHGTDGIVDSLSKFVPGEEVVIRGATSEIGILAVAFQSVYTSVTGTVTADRAAYVLATPSGQRVHVPQKVVQLHAPSGIRQGETCSATIWTHPATGEATALELTVGS